MKRRILLGLVLALLLMPIIAVSANAEPDTSPFAPSGSGDLSIGQIIALTVSTAVAIVGLWLYFRPKNKDEKISKTAITRRRF